MTSKEIIEEVQVEIAKLDLDIKKIELVEQTAIAEKALYDMEISKKILAQMNEVANEDDLMSFIGATDPDPDPTLN